MITVSNKGTAGERKDKSGKIIKKMLEELDSEIVYYKVIPDEREIIIQELKFISDSDQADLILTTGGTGFAERDITPEATAEIMNIFG